MVLIFGDLEVSSCLVKYIKFLLVQLGQGIYSCFLNGFFVLLCFGWNLGEQWPDFGCEGIKVQRAHQPTSQCQGKYGIYCSRILFMAWYSFSVIWRLARVS
eukprot:TRINITY_DN3984_c1_g1_i1.p1 TRINITY_DN3984_c1_g1~~TRINITY_DN3984_c1_g1_i1.p1  ORF type:complete len:101 (-),score=9.89 TRINITY_DN3984_c1_g1_i1:324-626(-)